MSEDIPLKNLINSFRYEISSAVETLNQANGLSKKLAEYPVEQLDREFSRLSHLLEDAKQIVRRASVEIFKSSEQWGFSSFTTLTSSKGTSSLASSSSRSTINPIISPAIHATKGTRKDYLERHYWAIEDGKIMQRYRETLTTNEKKFISQVQGESWGHFYVTDVLEYEEVFHGDNKSIRQGPDGIYFDTQSDSLVVTEFKGQNSKENDGQKQPDWTLETCRKIQRYQAPYTKVSEFEREAAAFILKEYEAGRTIRYEVIRTEVDPETGEMWTQLEKRTHLEAEHSPP
ncbi:MAG: hypothetical protein KME12_05770 [Trichocoleus desertorum ATA4-8-CV12]|jgi:hypothetical protein|nr:hypothetical protein [Trichocoleus desertorum ATA4-8-CV12]